MEVRVIVGADGLPALKVRWLGETMILRVSGDVTAARVAGLRATIDDLLEDRPLVLVLDLTAVTGFGDEAARSLFAAAEDADQATTIRLVAGPHVASVLRAARPDHQIRVFPDIARALAKH